MERTTAENKKSLKNDKTAFFNEMIRLNDEIQMAWFRLQVAIDRLKQITKIQ
jgi:hypothetical protein